MQYLCPYCRMQIEMCFSVYQLFTSVVHVSPILKKERLNPELYVYPCGA
jgi:hypothetical protein